MQIIEEKNLAFKGGNSDKVYNFQLVKIGVGYQVKYQNGKRGSRLTDKTKHEQSVTYEEAKRDFDKLLKSKLSDGYSDLSNTEETGVFQGTVYEERFTGIIGQMLNKITDAEKYIIDDNYFMQEKYDGERRLTKIDNKVVLSINKKGLEVPTLLEVAKPLMALNRKILVDGELIGDKYFIFDILELDDKNLRNYGAKKRYEILNSLGLSNVVPTYFSYKEKRENYDRLKGEKKEGVVFKILDSEYVSGRPNSLGDQLKLKFYATDTFCVKSHTKGKRSVNIISFTEEGKEYDMGKVTIPENFNMPDIGSFIEVRYLYCYVDGKLFQTTYLGERNDQDKSDCHMREIKFKASQDDDE